MDDRLLLASRSPRRRELLALLGLPFDVAVSDVEESPRAGELPAALVARLSQAKARAVCAEQERKGVIIVACDTIVTLDGDVLGKPRDAQDAISMLRRLRECAHHTVYSAVTLLGSVAHRAATDVVETRIVMRDYTDVELAAYVASGDPLDKAGAYAIQHDEFHPVAAWQGCYASVMGLPLCHLTRSLRAWGVEPVSNVPMACQASTGQDCSVYSAILRGCP